ncbi:MAG: T9SS type A sorting domain-containing protein, partial [Saprospiraceae bacterium]|nr:T9SS type A sorting domain-containing protein [Saprospiraceae bacterium]
QRGWIIAVDDYGCLVPGCHLVSPAGEPRQEMPVVLLYPNPVRDALNVYYRGKAGESKSSFFQIVDATGRVLKSWHSGSDDETMVVFADFLPTGSYFLQCMSEDGRLLHTVPFVKMK